MCLWIALGQEKQESCEESQEEEDAERHGPSLTAFQSMTVSTWSFYPKPGPQLSYITSSIPSCPSYHWPGG